MSTIIIKLPDGCNHTWVMTMLHRVLERQGISPKELRWVEEKPTLEKCAPNPCYGDEMLEIGGWKEKL